MYIKTTRFPVMEGEPHLGYIIETELIETVSEGRDIFIELFVDNQGVEETATTYDDYNEEDIELYIEDYFDGTEIDKLHTLFGDKEVTKEQILKEIN